MQGMVKKNVSCRCIGISEAEQETVAIFEVILTKNFFKIVERHQTAGSNNITKPKYNENEATKKETKQTNHGVSL